MLKLNAIKLMEEKGFSKYKLFNTLNSIRTTRDDKALNYNNFLKVIEQETKSIRYIDLEDLCNVLECTISELLTME